MGYIDTSRWWFIWVHEMISVMLWFGWFTLVPLTFQTWGIFEIVNVWTFMFITWRQTRKNKATWPFSNTAESRSKFKKYSWTNQDYVFWSCCAQKPRATNIGWLPNRWNISRNSAGIPTCGCLRNLVSVDERLTPSGLSNLNTTKTFSISDNCE